MAVGEGPVWQAQHHAALGQAAWTPGQRQEHRYGLVGPSFPCEGVPKVTAPTGTFPRARGEGKVSGSGP